jgi:hypothetical protein
MKSAKDRVRTNDSGAVNGARERRTQQGETTRYGGMQAPESKRRAMLIWLPTRSNGR